jgi:protein required for attachment to host cells
LIWINGHIFSRRTMAVMKRTCLIVADGEKARLFLAVPDDSPRRKFRLVEQTTLHNAEFAAHGRAGAGQVGSERNTNRQAGPVHPIGSQRERHRLEHERRFGAEIVKSAVALTMEWNEGVIVLIAEPRLLGLMRARLRGALKKQIALVELAKDYSGLTTTALEKIVVSQGLTQ